MAVNANMNLYYINQQVYGEWSCKKGEGRGAYGTSIGESAHNLGKWIRKATMGGETFLVESIPGIEGGRRLAKSELQIIVEILNKELSGIAFKTIDTKTPPIPNPQAQ